MKLRKIILVSSSPRRRKLLREAGLKFEAIRSDSDENLLISQFNGKDFKKLAENLSIGKILSALTTGKVKPGGNEILIAFDTVVILNKKILGKPKNKKHAFKMLNELSNKSHTVCTGIAVMDLKDKSIVMDHVITKVMMRKITKKESSAYIKTNEPMDKAGSYAIQGKGKKFIKSIKGDYYNVIGLPLERFIELLKEIDQRV